MAIKKKIVMSVTLAVDSGSGYCIIRMKGTDKTYQAQTPVHTILDNEQAVKLLFNQVMKQFYDGEINTPQG